MEYGLIGGRLGHSYSKVIHEMLCHGRGSPGLYDPAAVQGHQCHHPL